MDYMELDTKWNLGRSIRDDHGICAIKDADQIKMVGRLNQVHLWLIYEPS